MDQHRATPSSTATLLANQDRDSDRRSALAHQVLRPVGPLSQCTSFAGTLARLDELIGVLAEVANHRDARTSRLVQVLEGTLADVRSATASHLAQVQLLLEHELALAMQASHPHQSQTSEGDSINRSAGGDVDTGALMYDKLKACRHQAQASIDHIINIAKSQLLLFAMQSESTGIPNLHSKLQTCSTQAQEELRSIQWHWDPTTEPSTRNPPLVAPPDYDATREGTQLGSILRQLREDIRASSEPRSPS